MGWTTPKTWVDEELVSASDLNTHLRDNLNALKAPPRTFDSEDWEADADYSTTSGTFVDMDATDLSLDITTTGGDLLIMYRANHYHSAAGNQTFDFTIDGSSVSNDKGIATKYFAGSSENASIVLWHIENSVAAGTYTIRIQWKVGSGTGGAMAGGSGSDIHGSFVVMEI